MSAPSWEHEFPSTADDLVDLLDRAFPLTNFDVNTPTHVIHRELGKRDVVDFLRALQKERKEAGDIIFKR